MPEKSDRVNTPGYRKISLAPKFGRWFDGSHAVDAEGNPLTQYRGDHGETEDGDLHSQLGTYAFSDSPEVASTYAQRPNDPRMTAKAPRVVAAHIPSSGRSFTTPTTPSWSCTTSHRRWAKTRLCGSPASTPTTSRTRTTGGELRREVRLRGEGVRKLLDENPGVLKNLYMNSYRLLDNPEFVKEARARGFDGAIHMGNGESFDTTEYRVFDKKQVRSVARPDVLFQRRLPELGEAIKGNDEFDAFDRKSHEVEDGKRYFDLIDKKLNAEAL